MTTRVIRRTQAIERILIFAGAEHDGFHGRQQETSQYLRQACVLFPLNMIRITLRQGMQYDLDQLFQWLSNVASREVEIQVGDAHVTRTEAYRPCPSAHDP